MKAGFEPLSGFFRVWSDGKRYGDPYEWSAVVRFIERDIIEVCGVDKPVTPSIWRAVVKECRRMEVKTILFKRIDRDGKTRVRTVHVE